MRWKINTETRLVIDELQRIGYLLGDIEQAARDGAATMREYALGVLGRAQLPSVEGVDWEAVANAFDRRLFDDERDRRGAVHRDVGSDEPAGRRHRAPTAILRTERQDGVRLSRAARESWLDDGPATGLATLTRARCPDQPGPPRRSRGRAGPIGAEGCPRPPRPPSTGTRVRRYPPSAGVAGTPASTRTA